MSPFPPDEATWRNRFILINMVRIGGTAIVLLGLYLWHSDAIRPGGATEVGLPMAIVGLVISFLAPRVLARYWRTPPGP